MLQLFYIYCMNLSRSPRGLLNKLQCIKRYSLGQKNLIKYTDLTITDLIAMYALETDTSDISIGGILKQGG